MIPIAKPYLAEDEAEAARRVVQSGWLSQGPQVEAFEREFAAAVGAANACAVSSCTTALHLALLSVGVRPGDEVITASHSFIATANAIRACGAVPIFADIEPDTYNLDPASVADAVSRLTRAILCVHQMGMPCDIGSLRAIAADRGLALVEDAACAAGSEIFIDGAWRRIGFPIGTAVCFSFHPRKVITTGEGGMLTSGDAAFDRQFRLWRQHGMSVSDRDRHDSARVVFEEYLVSGYNYRMTDLQAAVGRKQLGRLRGLVARRRALAERYRAILACELPDVELPAEPTWARSNWQSYCVRLPVGLDQKAVMQRMLDGGVATRRGIMCAHREQASAGLPLRLPLPESEAAQDRCLLLPIYAQMTEAEQDCVVDALLRAVLVDRKLASTAV